MRSSRSCSTWSTTRGTRCRRAACCGSRRNSLELVADPVTAVMDLRVRGVDELPRVLAIAKDQFQDSVTACAKLAQGMANCCGLIICRWPIAAESRDDFPNPTHRVSSVFSRGWLFIRTTIIHRCESFVDVRRPVDDEVRVPVIQRSPNAADVLDAVSVFVV